MRSWYRVAWIAVVLLGAVGICQAQDNTVTVRGQVTALDSGNPLPGAHVMIAGSTRGTAADADGYFEMRNLPVDAYRIHVSMLGFEPVAQDTVLTEPGTYTLNFALVPAVLELDGAEVAAERDSRWQRRLERFKREFIGISENAEQTELLNPEVLEFSSSWGRFRAEASQPLQIRNYALGYEIEYHLSHFSSTRTRIRYDGDPFYREMEPESPEQQEEWKEARKDAYYGSLRHFLRAAMDDRIDDEGFVVFRIPRTRSLGLQHAGGREPRLRGRRHHFFEEADEGEHFELDFRGQLEIMYRHAPEPRAYAEWHADPRRVPADFRTSYLSLNDRPAVIDNDGDVVKPFAVTRYGFYAFTRLADSLPKEYAPPSER